MTDLPSEIQVWESYPKLHHTGTWATTRYPVKAVPYVRKADAEAAQALVVERAIKEGMRIAACTPVHQVQQAMDAAPDLARALIASEAARKLAEERLAAIVWSYDATHTFRTADMHSYDCKCLRCAVDAARAILKEIDNG